MKSTGLQLLILLMLAGVSCGDSEEGPAPRCGTDTVEVDHQCVPAVTCGPNTHLADHACVSDTDYQCGEETIENNGVCTANPGPTCGEGTVIEDSVCVLETRRACGTGTVDSSGVCIVAEPRTCGQGTRREGAECVPDPQCTENTVEVDNECISPRAVGATLDTVCAAIAKDYCRQVADCCDPYDPYNELGPLTQLLRDPTVCEEVIEFICGNQVIQQMAYVVSDEAEAVDDPYAVLAPFYTIDSCAIGSEIVDVALDAFPEDTLLIEAQQGPADTCIGNLSCIPPLTCVTNPEGVALCKEKGADAHRCDAYDNADCRDGYYCRHNSDDNSNLCAHYLGVGATDCSSTRLCDPTVAFCAPRSNECVARLAAGTSCLSDAQCAEGLYCRSYSPSGSDVRTVECAPYLALGDTCSSTDDLICNSELYCGPDGTCIDEVDICDATAGGVF